MAIGLLLVLPDDRYRLGPFLRMAPVRLETTFPCWNPIEPIFEHHRYHQFRPRILPRKWLDKYIPVQNLILVGDEANVSSVLGC